nr:hypothetical protein [Limosilactobacillus reuteri]
MRQDIRQELRSAMDVYCKAFYQEMSRSHQPIINWSVLFISA